MVVRQPVAAEHHEADEEADDGPAFIEDGPAEGGGIGGTGDLGDVQLDHEQLMAMA